MVDISRILEFDWDSGNIDKSYKKHSVTPNEAEELFLDENVLLVEDFKHSQKEKRFIAIGRSTQKKILFAAFTIRDYKIRIISARKANKSERRKYEKKP